MRLGGCLRFLSSPMSLAWMERSAVSASSSAGPAAANSFSMPPLTSAIAPASSPSASLTTW
eukprot:scaffold73734_cov38-Phaeocystis_antarctica.AAC.2